KIIFFPTDRTRSDRPRSANDAMEFADHLSQRPQQWERFVFADAFCSSRWIGRCPLAVLTSTHGLLHVCTRRNKHAAESGRSSLGAQPGDSHRAVFYRRLYAGLHGDGITCGSGGSKAPELGNHGSLEPAPGHHGGFGNSAPRRMDGSQFRSARIMPLTVRRSAPDFTKMAGRSQNDVFGIGVCRWLFHLLRRSALHLSNDLRWDGRFSVARRYCIIPVLLGYRDSLSARSSFFVARSSSSQLIAESSFRNRPGEQRRSRFLRSYLTHR